MSTYAVIGTQFGDEGKGITVDFLTRSLLNSIVVRYSGGQQAGHNVSIDGLSHIHANYASGALGGCPSFFSEHTTFYLNTLANEKEILESKGGNTKLYVHPLAKVTTPYDVAYNRALEKKNNHGSCGLGIAATHKRHEAGYKLCAIDLFHPILFNKKLNEISRYYNTKVADEGLDQDMYFEYIAKYATIFRLLAQDYKDYIDISVYEVLRNYENVVFECSQGIMLDMDHGIFPHVTWGSTTSKNAIDICKKARLDMPHIHYVTRCYSTRHGNGWMPNEGSVELINAPELTNTTNEWQKEFRTGEVDYELLQYALMVDAIYSTGITKSLVVTCLDQRPGFDFDYDKFGGVFKNIYESYSPDSQTIKKVIYERAGFSSR